MTTLMIAQPDQFADSTAAETKTAPATEDKPTLLSRLVKAVWDHSEELSEGSTKSFEGLL